MGECKLNHSLEDVRKKLLEQSPYLPNEICNDLHDFLGKSVSQELLNEIFHLLKKYDLSSKEEQGKRNSKMKDMLIQSGKTS